VCVTFLSESFTRDDSIDRSLMEIYKYVMREQVVSPRAVLPRALLRRMRKNQSRGCDGKNDDVKAFVSSFLFSLRNPSDSSIDRIASHVIV